jgi:hypothetical protein
MQLVPVGDNTPFSTMGKLRHPVLNTPFSIKPSSLVPMEEYHFKTNIVLNGS